MSYKFSAYFLTNMEMIPSDSDDTDYEVGKKNVKQKAKGRKAKKRICFRNEETSTTDTTDYTDELLSEEEDLNIQRKKKCAVKKERAFGVFWSEDESDDNYLPQGKLTTVKKNRTRFKKEQHSTEVQRDGLANNDTWSMLPPEILTKILHYVMADHVSPHTVRCVSRCALVCKQWCHVVSQPVSWQQADLAFMGCRKSANDHKLKWLVKTRLSEVCRLNLCGWVHLTDVGLQSVAKYCHKLRNLDISFCQRKSISKITNASLITLAESCPLTSVNLSHLRIGAKYAKTASRFVEILGANLTHLNFSGNIAFGSALLTSICNHCPSLLSIDVSNTSVRNVCFHSFQTSCPMLEELYFTNLNLTPKEFDHERARGFPLLKSCSLGKLHYPSWLNNNLLVGITKNAKSLSLLDVRGFQQLTSEGFNLETTKLQNLYLSSCNIDLQSVGYICTRWCDTLLELDLSKTVLRDDHINDVIGCLVNGNMPCKKLRCLNISTTAVTNNCVRVIVKCLQNLTSLDLTLCRAITRGFKRLHQGKAEIMALNDL